MSKNITILLTCSILLHGGINLLLDAVDSDRLAGAVCLVSSEKYESLKWE